MNEWIKHIEQKFASKKVGQFSATDTLGESVLLEWEKIDPKSPKLAEKINSASDLLVPAYTQMEIQFARKFPEVLLNEMFLKDIAPMFQHGTEKVDWSTAEQQTQETLKKFFTTTDWAMYSSTTDIQIFVVAKDEKTGKLLGIIQFLITLENAYGDVKIALYDGIKPIEKERGLEQLLISSIFKLIPETKRTYFHTRITNEEAINKHLELGFTQFPGHLTHWIDLEYLTERSQLLQKQAETLGTKS